MMHHRRHSRRRFAARIGTGMSLLGMLIAVSVPLAALTGGTAGASPGLASGCEPAHVITRYHFTINGKTVSTLHNLVHEGDSVEAFFTVAQGCHNIPVALVSHTSPDPTFVPSHVSQQRVYDSAKGMFDSGDHSLGPISVPPCNFQIDFAALENQGHEGYTYSSAVGGTSKCTSAPAVTITNTCVASSSASSGGVSITYDNTKSQRTDTFTLTSNIGISDKVVVPHGQTVTKVYPMSQGQTGTFTVTDDMSPPFSTTVTITHNCATPPPAVTQCSNGGDTVTFYPSPTSSTTVYSVQIVANGQTTTDTVTVGSSPVSKTYAATEDTPATITVKSSSGSTVLNQTLSNDCLHPSASVANQCTSSTNTTGVLVQATNEGSQPKTFSILKNSTVVGHLTVAPFSTASVVEQMAQGETATWQVTGPEGLATTPVTITHSCTAVLPVVITAPPGSSPAVSGTSQPAGSPATHVLGTQVGPLAVTGSNTGQLLALALGLMVAGGLIILASRRSQRSVRES